MDGSVLQYLYLTDMPIHILKTCCSIGLYINVFTLIYIKIHDGFMKSRDKTERKYTTITIPLPLFKKLKEKIEGTGFSSVSDCVTYILRETLVEMESEDSKDKNKNAVVEKLKALGYTM